MVAVVGGGGAWRQKRERELEPPVQVKTDQGIQTVRVGWWGGRGVSPVRDKKEIRRGKIARTLMCSGEKGERRGRGRGEECVWGGGGGDGGVVRGGLHSSTGAVEDCTVTATLVD